MDSSCRIDTAYSVRDRIVITEPAVRILCQRNMTICSAVIQQKLLKGHSHVICGQLVAKPVTHDISQSPGIFPVRINFSAVICDNPRKIRLLAVDTTASLAEMTGQWAADEARCEGKWALYIQGGFGVTRSNLLGGPNDHCKVLITPGA